MQWILDSGATNYITDRRESLTDLRVNDTVNQYVNYLMVISARFLTLEIVT